VFHTITHAVARRTNPNPWEPIKYQGFVNGTVLVCTGGDWQWEFDWGPKGANPITDIYNKVDRWMFPSSVGEPFDFATMGTLVVIAAQCKHIPDAFEFAKYYMAGQGSCDALKILFDSPSAITDYGDHCPYYNTGVNGKMAESAKMLLNGRSLQTGPGEAQIADGLALATENIITGSQTSQQAMEAFAKSMTDLLGADAVKQL
jgi:multiple sugar transport system substrate-binding protein